MCLELVVPPIDHDRASAPLAGRSHLWFRRGSIQRFTFPRSHQWLQNLRGCGFGGVYFLAVFPNRIDEIAVVFVVNKEIERIASAISIYSSTEAVVRVAC